MTGARREIKLPVGTKVTVARPGRRGRRGGAAVPDRAAPRFLTERLRAEARAKTALAPAKGRGVGGSKAGRTGGVKAKKVKARTVYLPDDLFERVWIQAHRKGITISEYVTWALGRQVPGPRSMRDVDDTAA